MGELDTVKKNTKEPKKLSTIREKRDTGKLSDCLNAAHNDREKYKSQYVKTDPNDYYHTTLAGYTFSAQIYHAAEYRYKRYKKTIFSYANHDGAYSDRTYDRIVEGNKITKETAIKSVVPFEFISPEEKIWMIHNAGYYLSDTITVDKIIKNEINRGITDIQQLEEIIIWMLDEPYFNIFE